ncbi:hypothetical protein [Chryseobacterium indologenes]|uniref:hypothetical protein n=1 Tax=Chryseobacterium indologenes TaxID=253 RepID=UPI003D32B91A
MKTKLIILAAIASALLYSCSSDRDENVTPNPVSEKTIKPENFKLNNQGKFSVPSENAVKSDSIIIRSEMSLPENPEDGGDPKDVPIPPRR